MGKWHGMAQSCQILEAQQGWFLDLGPLRKTPQRNTRTSYLVFSFALKPWGYNKSAEIKQHLYNTYNFCLGWGNDPRVEFVEEVLEYHP